MTPEKIREILTLHGKWLRSESDGVKADLSGADLSGSNLSGSNLKWADLKWADLKWADLKWADLKWADLCEANLYKANLYEANLSGADLSGANLSGADLSGAKFYKARLNGAFLEKAKNIPEHVYAQTLITPEGDLIGWKKCRNGVIVKLLIPSAAKRSNSTGRKCRAEYATTLEVIGAEVGISQHDGITQYRKGETIHCDRWEEDRWIECAGGIHFFITRYEAENY